MIRMGLSDTDRITAVQLVFDSGFVDEAIVVGIVGAAISNWNPRMCYMLICATVLPFRQRFILWQLLAETVLDDVPDTPQRWHIVHIEVYVLVSEGHLHMTQCICWLKAMSVQCYSFLR